MEARGSWRTDPRVTESIEGLYDLFANRYELPSHVVGCPCCVSDADQERIHVAPLGDLTAEDLDRYAFKAMTTWGTVNDFKHMLPRILELQACDPDWLGDVQAALGKLAYGGWLSWPADEQAALRAYLHGCWEAGLDSYADWPNRFGPEDWLEGIVCAGDDTAWYIYAWRETASESALLHLTGFVIDVQSQLAAGTLAGPYTAHPEYRQASEKCAQQVCAWLFDPVLHARLEQLALVDEREPFAGAAAGGVNTTSLALLHIDALRSSAGAT